MKTDLKQKITEYSLSHYKLITIIMAVITLVLGALIPLIRVDTDPENMLSQDEAVRIFHNQTKKQFSLNDIVVVGIVNDKDPNGVFNPASLVRIYELTEFAKTLRWPDEKNPNEEIGVVEVDLLAPSTVDHIGQGGPGEVKFEWLMQKPPATSAEAMEIRDKAMSNPLLNGTIVSEDGRAICLYLPLTNKDLSYKVYSRLKEKIAALSGDEKYHITGLPVAEDTFGVEMFIQMAVSAPLAMVVIFILMLLFFRKLVLVISPMIIAMVSVISTMGLLIGLGYPVHIMSSMIPIFLMPIAVVDSVHILSEFFDRYSPKKGRRETIVEVMGNLFTPMLYTSLTSAAGFASLALTPIPPVQVFGIFVAVGIMIAWVFTVTFVPAYVMMVKESSLANFGTGQTHSKKQSWLARLLNVGGRFTYKAAKPILIIMLVITAVAIYGITQIKINDNPVKWFSKSHPIRVADTELNKHFGGTYMAYLVLSSVEEDVSNQYITGLEQRLAKKSTELKEEFPNATTIVSEAEKFVSEQKAAAKSKDELLDKLSGFTSGKIDTADENDVDIWNEVANFFDLEKERLKIFKQPEVLRYIERLQGYLAGIGVVGKSNSVADVVKKVYQELKDGRKESFVVPDSEGAVAQCLMQFQSSHNPDDLWHLVTYDYMHANIWLQLTSGDNKDMQKVVEAVDNFFKANPPPVPMKYSWAGLTYINVVWQDKMVWGMLQSFLGSFIVVFIMMAILFRSVLWGLICMLPLTITIVIIYGIIGLAGKDYDMPVAVLSALTLGMAVDFAIHFLERARGAYRQSKSWEKASAEMFGEPARAISRNVIVIAIGFLPLLAAPLMPYKTVGIFVCAIMAASGVVTLLILPAIIRILEKKLFKTMAEPMRPSCNCAFCAIISAATVLLVAVNVHQFAIVKWNTLVWISIIAIPIMAMVCGIISRRAACRRAENNLKEKQ
ncbi:MAG: efflux RND transporter permease subunit [Phycisphaerae bacterium]|nr:efflux RND transporter permease subunit [Phycisphaerae bacterium]MDD5381373.1 efflux RND transporter permease subunit [Phycisphaerae bacterium]